jgi:predicted lactoylglutathione lyase
MELGAFSVSLAVTNIEESKVFYQNIGFKVIGGEQSQNWLILRSGDHTIGLFQGMFESNIMTFNPGWDQKCQKQDSFTDIREILRDFQAKGIDIVSESISGETGPSSFSIKDPDGNSILIDQHV